MKKVLKVVAVFLLIFLGFGGVYGGWMLISDPSGGKFRWSMDLLQGTPFKSFLIPGIVLLITNGILPLCIALLVLLKKNAANWLILFQGLVVIGWLTAQLIFNPDFFVPVTHYTSYSIGLLLVLVGLLLLRFKITF